MAGKLQYGPNDYRFKNTTGFETGLETTPITEEEPSIPKVEENVPFADVATGDPQEEWNMAEQRIRSISKQINPYYNTPKLQNIEIPKEQARKYLDMGFGYIPGVDNDDFYSDTQGVFKTLGKTALRIPALITTKLGQNIGFLGSLPYAVATSPQENIIADAADNTFSNFFKGVEDNVKNEWLRTFNSSADKQKGFFARMFTDKDFWADDFVDGAAFMGAAWIPGFALNKLRLNSRVMGSIGKIFNKPIVNPSMSASLEALDAGTRYFSNAQKFANTIGKFNSVAMATASESLFEASEIKNNIYNSLSADEFGRPRINPNTGEPYTEEEKKQIAAGGAQNGFLMNAALLGITNLFELPYVTKLFGGSAPGVVSGITGGAKLGEDLVSKVAKTKWSKFLDSGYGTFAKGLGVGIFREGLIEENVQLGIQRFNELYGTNGVIADILDYKSLSGFGSQVFDQTLSAFKGKDPEAAMNIGMGGLLGGGMTGFVEKSQAKKDKLTTEQVVKYFNDSQSNFLKFGNIFKTQEVDVTDENGNIKKESKILFDVNNQPVIDNDKIGAVLSNAKSYMTTLNMSDDLEASSPFLRNILRDSAFSIFVNAHIRAGIENTLLSKLDSLNTASVEDLAKLGFVKDDNFSKQLDRYKTLASKIINQNKLINSDIFFDDTEDDLARKNTLINLASNQAIFRSLAGEEQLKYDELKNQFINSSNSSLSDGLVDQLNQLELRIKSQKQVIDSIKNSSIKKPVYISVQEKVLSDLEIAKEKLLKDNETTVASLTKGQDGFYRYEKDARNDVALFNSLNKKLKTIGELENQVTSLGKEWSLYADLIDGKKNFMSVFDETVTQTINQEIDNDNKTIEEDNLVDTVNIEDMEETGTTPMSALQPVTPTSAVTPGVPSLEDYLKEKYDLLKQNGQVTVPYENWKQSGAANTFIKLYNEKYKKSEKPATTKKTESSEEEISSDLLEDQEDELPDEFRDVLTADEDEDLTDELGVESLSSLKLGSYVINTGDKINDEEIKLITDKTVVVGDNIMSYDEVRKALDAFRGRNITRKGETATSGTEVPENGEIIDVQETQVSTLNQKIQDAIDKANSNVVFGGSAKVIQGGSKINNRSDNYIVEVYTKPGGGKRIDRQRTSPNPNYPMVMSTPDINKGTPIKLIADTEIKDFREEDSLDPSKIKVRKASDFFDGSKVKTSALNNFPIRIDAEIDGKTVSLGYLPTMDWLEARWPDGETMNVVEFITLPSGEKINNLEIQKTKLTNLRKQVLEGQNKNSKFILESVVSDKSDGLLRTSSTLKKLSKIVKPDTKLGIIRNGLIHLENDEVLDSSDVIANFDSFSGKEGWPVVLLSTPTGNTFASFLSVPKLAPEHQDFIVTAWNAFHVVKDAKDLSTVKPFVNIVKAVYDVMETPYQEGVVVDFNVLKSYVNNYITFASGRQYNPLAKEGTSQLNITEDGKLTVWSVKEKTKDKDVFIANNPTEFVKKEAGFREKLSELYYNVKTTTEFSQGINSTKKMKFLSSVGGSVKITSSPMTYNDYMMNILETNIEPGRPVDASDPNSELVYFANPVLTFDQVKSNEAELEAEEKKATTSTAAGPITAPVSTAPVSDLRKGWVKFVAKNQNISEKEAAEKLKDAEWVTLYRAEGDTINLEETKLPDYVKKSRGRWFTNDENVARGYAKTSPNAKLYAVEVPKVFYDQVVEEGKKVGLGITAPGEVLIPIEVANSKVELSILEAPVSDDVLSNIESFETAMGSVYTILPDGKTQRFKTATGKQSEANDLIVFVKFTDEDQEQRFLRGVQDEASGTKVYVIDQQGNKYSKNSDIRGKDVKLTLVDAKTNNVLETVETKQEPTIGYNTYDERRFTKDGDQYRSKHIGNKVTKINYKKGTTAYDAELDALEGKSETKVESTIDVKAKKADIEKRRQEELDNIISEELTEENRRPNGSIGTQGFDPTQMKNLIKFLNKKLSLNIDEKLFEGEKLKPLIDFIKGNKDLVEKIKQYVKTDPIEISRMPDGSLSFRDGNHRANLLNLIGSEVLPTIEVGQRNKIDEINAKYDAELAKELYKEMKAGKTVLEFTPAEQKILGNPAYESIREEVFKEKPTEGLAGLAAQAAPETGELLDLDLDLGDIAEDIGKPDDTGLKSIRTSLKELKKTCD